jgi:hypothetical protein
MMPGMMLGVTHTSGSLRNLTENAPSAIVLEM